MRQRKSTAPTPAPAPDGQREGDEARRRATKPVTYPPPGRLGEPEPRQPKMAISVIHRYTVSLIISRCDMLAVVVSFVPSRRTRRVPRADGVDYPTLADLRYRMRRFVRSREIMARAAGIAPQQYLALLQIKGLEGRGLATIGVLAERLQIHHHGVVQLVDRLVRRGMVKRHRDGPDRRRVIVMLRPPGEAVLRRLALSSLAELRSEGPALATSLTRLVRKSTSARAATRARGDRTLGKM